MVGEPRPIQLRLSARTRKREKDGHENDGGPGGEDQTVSELSTHAHSPYTKL